MQPYFSTYALQLDNLHCTDLRLSEHCLFDSELNKNSVHLTLAFVPGLDIPTRCRLQLPTHLNAKPITEQKGLGPVAVI